MSAIRWRSLGVDDGQAAIAISDQNLIGGAVHADIVGVLAKIDLPGRGIIRSRENAHRSIARVCDVKRIRRRQVSDALWLLQSPHRSNDLFVLEVDDPDGVVAKFGNEEPLPRQINRHVIDSAAHFAEGNLGFELQRLRDWSTNPDQQRRRCDRYRKRETSKRDHQVGPSLHAPQPASARASTSEPQFARGIRSYRQPATGSPVTRS